tara:strand:+ start:56 stop:610 length:555 start_codon:yes stop_codon:yes gene_type:complete
VKRFGVSVFVLFSSFLLSEDESQWSFYESDDPIDGYWSVVSGEDDKGRALRFFDSGALLLENGDGYICPDTYEEYKKLKVIFKIDDEDHFYQKFAISDGRDALVFRESYIKEGYRIEKKDSTKDLATKSTWGSNFASGLDLKKFTNKLKTSNKLFIRTRDGCGSEVSILLDLKGFTKAISNIYE